MSHIESSFKEVAKIRDGFNIRDAQIDFAEKIYDFIDHRARNNAASTSWISDSPDAKALLIEAGTGTGKSLGYLIPVLKHNIKAIISTNTKALQKQVAQELKSLSKLYPGVRYKVMEGAANYACMFKASKAGYVSVQSWMTSQAKKGSGMIHEFKDRKGNFRKELWDQIATDSNLCEKECEFFDACFFQKAKEEARTADILVLNHDLLLLHYMLESEIFHTFDTIIIDEAHHLPDKARKVFTQTLGPQTIFKHITTLNTKLIEIYKCPQAYIEEAKYQEMQERIFSFFPAGEPQSIQVTELHEDFKEAVRELRTSILADAQWLKRVSQDMSPPNSKKTLDKFITSDIKKLVSRAEMLESMFLDESDNQYLVYSVEPKTNKFVAKFEATPLDVGPHLNQLFDKKPVVLLSATLRSGNSFDFFKNQIGQPNASTFRYPSPFAQTNTKIFIPTEAIEPANTKGDLRDKYIATLARYVVQIHERMEGRTLFLFTNKADLEEVIGSLPAKTREQFFVQKHTSEIPAMIRAIKDSDNLSLAGLNAMWEGIDVVGKSLSCVCIMRMPFVHPEDIFVKAMKQKYISDNRREYEFFTDYDLPQMMLKLRQGIGRLIRHETDTGVIAIIDNRFMKKTYGHNVVEILRDYDCFDDFDEAIENLPKMEHARFSEIDDIFPF